MVFFLSSMVFFLSSMVFFLSSMVFFLSSKAVTPLLSLASHCLVPHLS